MRSLLYSILIILFVLHPVYAQRDHYITLSNSRSRAVSMGGATTAVEDDIGAISFNPGAFDLLADRSQTRLMVYFNPVLPIVSYEQPAQFLLSGGSDFKRYFGGIPYLFKAATLSTGAFDFGILLDEEQYLTRSSKKFFNGEAFINNWYHSAVVRVRLSSQVSFGITGCLLKTEENSTVTSGTGWSYGILVKPSSMYQIGIMYFDVTNSLHNVRRRFDRLSDESLNTGFAFFPVEKFTIAVDVRNLTESSKAEKFGLQELHMGFESTYIKHMTIRGGFYREKSENGTYTSVFSTGVGLIDINSFKSVETQYNHMTPLITYTILFENTPVNRYRWHFLAICFRI
jgi:hypothetical protein